MYDSRGCDTCSDGFRGRVGVFQLLLVNDEIAELTTQRPSRDVLKNAAFAAGMRTLHEDGLDKVARGLTTLAELERALPERVRDRRFHVAAHDAAGEVVVDDTARLHRRVDRRRPDEAEAGAFQALGQCD